MATASTGENSNSGVGTKRRNEEIIERLTRVETQLFAVVAQIQSIAANTNEVTRDARDHYERFREALSEQRNQLQAALTEQREDMRRSRLADQELFGNKLTEITKLFVKKSDLVWLKTLFMILLPLGVGTAWAWLVGHVLGLPFQL